MNESTQKLSYFEQFGVDKTLLKRGLDAALSLGGDHADLYFEHRLSRQIGMQDQAVDRAYSGISLGVGIRVVCGERTGYAYTESLTLDAIRDAAKVAAQVARSSGVSRPKSFEVQQVVPRYEMKTPWADSTVESELNFLHQIREESHSLSSNLVKVRASLAHSVQHVLHAHADGRVTYDCRPMGSVNVQCTAEKNGQRETNGCSRSLRMGREFFDAQVMSDVTRHAVENTHFLFDAKVAPAGQLPLVLASGASGILLHEAIGHGLEADFNRKGISIYADKLNERIACDEVSIVDDGTIHGARGALSVDDEGEPTERTVLVENGFLKGYIHDSISAKSYGVKPSGNGRRQSFRHPPLPRMRCTYMTPGDRAPEEIIQSVKRGVYAKSFTNGSVMIGAGDFSFFIKTGYLIEDGKLTQPIKDTNIIGNGPSILADTDLVGSDFKMDASHWVCGKDGQSVPVSLGMPTVRIKSINIGGVN